MSKMHGKEAGDSDINCNGGAPIGKDGDEDGRNRHRVATAFSGGLVIESRQGYIAEMPMDSPVMLRVNVPNHRATSIENTKKVKYPVDGKSWTLFFGSHGAFIHYDQKTGEFTIVSMIPWIKRGLYVREHPLQYDYNSVSLMVGGVPVDNFDYTPGGGMTIHYDTKKGTTSR